MIFKKQCILHYSNYVQCKKFIDLFIDNRVYKKNSYKHALILGEGSK